MKLLYIGVNHKARVNQLAFRGKNSWLQKAVMASAFALPIAGASNVQAQIPMKPPEQKIKRVETPKIENVKDLKAMEAALFQEETKLKDATLEWAKSLRWNSFKMLYVLYSDKAVPTKESQKFNWVENWLSQQMTAHGRIESKTPTLEQALSLRLIALGVARSHRLFQQGYPKWNEPVTFAQRYVKVYKNSQSSKQDDKKTYANGLKAITEYLKARKAFFTQARAFSKQVQVYDKAAVRLKQEPYFCRWGIGPGFVGHIAQLSLYQAPQKGKKESK